MEIGRVKDFDNHYYVCECGEEFDLWWNNGELDEHQCSCGKFYYTEHQTIDLVICDKRPGF